MAKRGFKVLDSDLHIVEPPDLWQRYIDPEFKDLTPRGRTQGIADIQLTAPDGGKWGDTRPPQELDEEQLRAVEAIAWRDRARYIPYEERGWTGEGQLDAMDVEGIDAAVLYPSRGLFLLTIPGTDTRLAAAMARAYNDWLYEFCQADTSRLMGAGMISVFDIEDAVSEARRCVEKLGFKGIFLRPNMVNGRNWHDPYYEPLWSTLEDLEVPLGFHEGGLTLLGQVGEGFGANDMLRHTLGDPGEQMIATVSICGGGVLERHPNLRVAFLEGNCSWLPFLMWRLDEHWERWRDVYGRELKMAPSDYFKRQCFASVEPDETPAKYVIDYMGNDRLVFSTDFPHGDSRFPDSVDYFLKLPISDEDKRKILWDNCANYYGLDNK